jgi:hypothetical protein
MSKQKEIDGDTPLEEKKEWIVEAFCGPIFCRLTQPEDVPAPSQDALDYDPLEVDW